MVSLWFEQYDCDCLQLIKAVRLDADEKDVAETVKVAEFALKCIFRFVLAIIWFCFGN